MIDSVIVRQAMPDDAKKIVSLFCEIGCNDYNWNRDKWLHYYVNYPEGNPVSFVAELKNKIIGHYGILPVRIGSCNGMLGLHAYVSTQYRGLTVLSNMMKKVDDYCVKENLDLICGFANPSFALIKKIFFKWHIPFWLGFKKNIQRADVLNKDKKFYFEYSDDWFKWRFHEDRSIYISKHKDSQTRNIRKQCLKLKYEKQTNIETLLDNCEGWSPSYLFTKQQSDQFCQPFSLKVYNPALLDKGIFQMQNWFIEMGDSDTFIYLPY